MNTAIQDLEKSIAEVMINELKLEDVTPDTFDPHLDFVDELGIDSMDLTTMVLVLEDKYDIQIDEDDYPSLVTLNKIALHITEKLKG